MAPTAGGTYATDTGGRSGAAPARSVRTGTDLGIWHARSTDLFSEELAVCTGSIYLEINYPAGLASAVARSLSAVGQREEARRRWRWGKEVRES